MFIKHGYLVRVMVEKQHKAWSDSVWSRSTRFYAKKIAQTARVKAQVVVVFLCSNSQKDTRKAKTLAIITLE